MPNGFDPSNINMLLRNIPAKTFDKKFMTQLGLDAIADMSIRVQQEGKGTDDQPMKPYTAAYAKRRERGFKPVGKRKKGAAKAAAKGGKAVYQVKYRDLTVTGQMLSNINVLKSNSTSCTIGLASHEEDLKAQGNQKNSPWFGLTEREQRKALDRVRKHIKTVIG